MVDRLKQEYEGRIEFRIVNVDTDPNAAALSAQYRVSGVPMFVFLDETGTQRDPIIGKVPEETLRAALEALL